MRGSFRGASRTVVDSIRTGLGGSLRSTSFAGKPITGDCSTGVCGSFRRGALVGDARAGVCGAVPVLDVGDDLMNRQSSPSLQ